MSEHVDVLREEAELARGGECMEAAAKLDAAADELERLAEFERRNMEEFGEPALPVPITEIRWHERNHAKAEGRAATIRRLEAELARRQHIIHVLRRSIEMTALNSSTVEDHVRVRDNRAEVWLLGKWLDLEDEQHGFVEQEEDEG